MRDTLCLVYSKIDSMKEDLGSNQVYDFMGDLLYGDINLAELMKEVYLSRSKIR